MDPLPTRRTLLGRLKNIEDNESWREFFNTYWRLIFEVAIKAGLNESEAEEVVQETVISVVKKIPTFDYDPAQGSFKGWLLNLTRWRITDQFRKRPPVASQSFSPIEGETKTSVLYSIADPSISNLEAIWNEEWSKNLMEVALERVKRKVKAKHYQIFDLYVLQKWPIKRVTSTMGVSLSQVYLAKHRLGRLLKKEVASLEKNEPAPPL